MLLINSSICPNVLSLLTQATSQSKSIIKYNLAGSCLRTFTLVVYAHPFRARNLCRDVMPCYESSTRPEETIQTDL